MGLSTKQVSSDDHGWNQALLQASTLELAKPTSMKKQSSQQQQQEGEPLKCPRCDSTNTKFCYYNNYNKSQPRHFCKACKRHWTKGGTLRNVPVGGGRKNKRKTSNAAGKSASKTAPVTTTTTTLFSEISNTHMTIQAQQPMLTLPIQTLKGINDKNFSEAFYQTLGRQPSCSMPESDLTLYNKSFSENNGGIFLGSTLNLLQNDQDLQFPYSNLGSFESNPNPNPNPGSISSIQSPNLYNYTGEGNALEETVMNSTNMAMSSSSMSDHQQPWQISNITNGVMDMAGNWGWDDFDKFVSVDADLGVPWDESEVKP